MNKSNAITFTDVEDLGEPVLRVRHLLDVVTDWTEQVSYDEGQVSKASSQVEQTEARRALAVDVSADIDKVQAVLQCAAELLDQGVLNIQQLTTRLQEQV